MDIAGKKFRGPPSQTNEKKTEHDKKGEWDHKESLAMSNTNSNI